jgi:hypothetical protein
MSRFFVIELKSRDVEIAGIAVDPGEEWMKQVARNLTDPVDGFLRGALSKASGTGTLRSLHMMVAEKKLDLAVRVCSTPLERRKMQTSLPVGTPRSFTLLSVPFYLVSEIPRLVGEILQG